MPALVPLSTARASCRRFLLFRCQEGSGRRGILNLDVDWCRRLGFQTRMHYVLLLLESLNPTHIYIYIYISAGPNGAHGCEDLLCSLVSLPFCPPAISLFFWSPVLFSRFSGSVFFVLSGLIEDCWGHGGAKIAPKNLIPLNHPDLAQICLIICRRLKRL